MTLSRPAEHQGADLDELRRAYDRKRRLADYDEDGQYRGGYGNHNGSTKFANWMLSINATLLTVAIGSAVWFAINCSSRISILETNLAWLMLGHCK